METEPLNLKSPSVTENDFPFATDLYELTMAAAYFRAGQVDRRGVFEAFVRKLPRNRSYMVAAGLEQVLQYALNLRFGEDHIAYLRSSGFKSAGEDFFQYLRDFRFTGDIWAAPEGTILFPAEPIVRVEAPIIEAQILETYLLSMINFQSLIATKASRIASAAGESKKVVEFGFRRAHGPQAALLAARASYIGGCAGSSNTLAAYRLGIPAFGTMAHSFVMNFESEMEAFQEFNKTFPGGFLLVDTYDTVAAVEKIVRAGIPAGGIRLDSGDLYELGTKTRKILDDAGYSGTKIMASGDLNEYIIQDLVARGAPIDWFGVGTELVTSRDDPAMNGVYKLVAIKLPSKEEGAPDRVLYKLKTSPGKKTYPGAKQVYRMLDENGLVGRDVVALEDEVPPAGSFPLLKKYVEGGKIVNGPLPTLGEIQSFHREQMRTLPGAFKSLTSMPDRFPVTFSERLGRLAQELRPAS